MTPLARCEEVTVYHGGLAVVLRPSLRAAMTLERLRDGWPGLLLKLDQFDVRTVRAILRASAVDRNAVEALLASFAVTPIAAVKEATLAPLSALLALFLAPMQEETACEAKPSRGRVTPWVDAYAEFYHFGTGWLGWSPAETWVATPTEIAQAIEGKLAHLIAMNGGDSGAGPSGPAGPSPADYTPERLREIEELGFDPAFDREALHRLKAKG
ncbi:phage tail assembly chaperone [Phaeovulum vinaykumarii]|uniref:Phage tail assembly chaperone protein, TAC n=1 Tax=Phaeovulum vinaykumarii TaxID=407234 RepID=A0A1N7K618_9RHOB|nr:phage tail assembly chaperone [Phaeovulum vinaykumarii]SIS57065.1 Phage tail assembly chaperone protein, TAC [Phaeovulum vinaykumarii]SOB93254.1 tail assembly chaperone [Phaeovulum vinaykumarii]